MKKSLVVFLLFFLHSSYAQTTFYSVLESVSGKAGNYALYSSEGKRLTDRTYNWLQSNRWGWVFATDHGLITVLDSTGRETDIDSIEEIHHIWEGATSIPLKKNGRWGYYSNTGKLLIPHSFDDVTLFKEGKAAVMKGGEYYYIDLTGTRLAGSYEPNDDYAFLNFDLVTVHTEFYNAPQETFTKKGKTGLKDAATGKVLIEAKYDGLYSISARNVIAKLNGKFGVVDFSGQEIIPVNYDEVYLLGEDA